MGMSVRGGATRPASAEQDSNRSKFQMAYGLGGNETPRLDVGAFLRDDPEASLKSIVLVGDGLTLGGEQGYKVVSVNDKSVTASRGASDSIRLVVGRDGSGQAVGLKRAGTTDYADFG